MVMIISLALLSLNLKRTNVILSLKQLEINMQLTLTTTLVTTHAYLKKYMGSFKAVSQM